VLLTARRAFDHANDDQTSALVAQFTQEFSRRGDEVSKRLQAAASTPEAGHIAVAAAQTPAKYTAFVDDAQAIAQIEQLDFLEFADDKGAIISSAQWPAKFGYQEPLAAGSPSTTPFLKDEETPSGHALGLFSVRTIPTGDRKLYLIGGIRLDRSFLSSLKLPSGMRVMLYENVDHSREAFSANHLVTSGAALSDPSQFESLVRNVQHSGRPESATVQWSSGESELIHAFPLAGERGQLLGILLVGNSRQIYTVFRNQIRSAALLAAGAGLLLAIILSSWAAARVTRPVEQLAHAAHQVAEGDWGAYVSATSNDEIGQLADSFNRMTRDLLDQREELVQSERVAAWRELARRLAHELKNPLFPLQLTVENLLRARELGEDQFSEIFRESSATLLTEIANLKNIIGRFSEFSRMPQPEFQPVELSELIQNVVKVFQVQLAQGGITCHAELSASDKIAGDPELLHRALSNLISNAIEAMPQGGTLTLRTSQTSTSARIEVADTGPGLGAEDSARLFTPYYTSKPHGTGLGLAIARQAVLAHDGTVEASSTLGKGTQITFILPALSSSIERNA
jgi:signal transduction histidine kinase